MSNKIVCKDGCVANMEMPKADESVLKKKDTICIICGQCFSTQGWLNYHMFHCAKN